MKPTEDLFLLHILDAIERIDLYIGNMEFDEFTEALAIQDAVIRQLEIIGEATKQISSKTQALAPDIPWRDIAGMRDKLIHGYFSVNLNDVWLTGKQDLSPLRDAIELIQKQKQSGSN